MNIVLRGGLNKKKFVFICIRNGDMSWIIGEIRKEIERLGREIESRRIPFLELHKKFFLNKSVIALKTI